MFSWTPPLVHFRSTGFLCLWQFIVNKGLFTIFEIIIMRMSTSQRFLIVYQTFWAGIKTISTWFSTLVQKTNSTFRHFDISIKIFTKQKCPAYTRTCLRADCSFDRLLLPNAPSPSIKSAFDWLVSCLTVSWKTFSFRWISRNFISLIQFVWSSKLGRLGFGFQFMNLKFEWTSSESIQFGSNLVPVWFQFVFPFSFGQKKQTEPKNFALFLAHKLGLVCYFYARIGLTCVCVLVSVWRQFQILGPFYVCLCIFLRLLPHTHAHTWNVYWGEGERWTMLRYDRDGFSSSSPVVCKHPPSHKQPSL